MKMLQVLLNGSRACNLMFDALFPTLPMRFVVKVSARPTGEAELYALSYQMQDAEEFETQLALAFPVFDVEDEVTVEFEAGAGECRFTVDVADKPLPGTPTTVAGPSTLIVDWAGRSTGRGVVTCVTCQSGFDPSAAYGEFVRLGSLRSGDKISLSVCGWPAA
jgi:hypothetical protein